MGLVVRLVFAFCVGVLTQSWGWAAVAFFIPQVAWLAGLVGLVLLTRRVARHVPWEVWR